MEPATSEPQQVQFDAQAACGASHDFGADWVTYAVNTAAPAFVQGVDHALNPQLGDQGGDGGTAIA
jgi:hypothetical protein